MISDFIKNLQDRSDKAKEKILWGVVVVSVAMSIAVWSLSFGSYKAVFQQPLDDGMMEGLRASVTQLESSKVHKVESTTDNEIFEQTADDEGVFNTPLQMVDDPAVAPFSDEATAGEEEEIKYNRLPVDED